MQTKSSFLNAGNAATPFPGPTRLLLLPLQLSLALLALAALRHHHVPRAVLRAAQRHVSHELRHAVGQVGALRAAPAVLLGQHLWHLAQRARAAIPAADVCMGRWERGRPGARDQKCGFLCSLLRRQNFLDRAGAIPPAPPTGKPRAHATASGSSRASSRTSSRASSRGSSAHMASKLSPSGCSACSGAPRVANRSPWCAHSSTPCWVAPTVLAMTNASTWWAVIWPAAPASGGRPAALAMREVMSWVPTVHRVWPLPGGARGRTGGGGW